MTLTPYSISESTKISEAYLNNVLNEAVKKKVVKPIATKAGNWLGRKLAGQGDDVVMGVTRGATKNTSKGAGRAAANKAANTTDDAGRAAANTTDDAGRAAANTTDDAGRAAAKAAAKNADNLSRPLTQEEMALLNPKIHAGRDAYNAVKTMVQDGYGALKDLYKGGRDLYRGGRDLLKHTPRWVKKLAGGTVVLGGGLGGGYAAADALTDGGLSTAVRYAANIPSKEQQQAYNDAAQQNVDITRENNNQLNGEALMALEKGIGSGDGTAANTNRVGQILYSMGYTDPNDIRLKPYINLKNVLQQVKQNDDNAVGIQESEAEEGIENAEKILSRRNLIPQRVVAPTTQSGMDDATAKMNTERYQNVKLDPSAKSWSGNLKDFIFDNPYLTATVLTLPVLTYIISKHGASLIDAIKKKGKNGVSGKEFVIVDNGKFLHSTGFSNTISKDIAIFKNRADAQAAIKALNAVTKSNYRIEELSKVIG